MTASRYEYGIDFGAVAAIDIHTHVEIDSAGGCAYDPELAEATGRYFKLGPDHFTRVDDLADQYRRNNTAAVVFTVDARTASGHVPNSVEELIEGTIRNNDVLIPFGSVDPLTGDAAVRRVNELVAEILSAPTCPGAQPAAADQGVVRHRSPVHHAGTVAAGLRNP